MRELTFRAWDDTLLKMHVPATLEQIAKNDLSCCNWYQLKIMQYIGLKDKNGKEIYEGDLLGYPPFTSPESPCYITPKIVEWDEQYACWSVVHGMGREAPAKWCKRMEVIGNIYEHPHLLEVQK